MIENSFSRINYYLRPNKQVERKILIDILLQFRKYIDLDNFSYIGMGSIYYYDFILIHRFLGIKNLVSFDSAKTVKRFEFNKPYDFVNFLPRYSTVYLAEHPWKETNTITWLDYDGTFHDNIESIINDIKIIAKNCNNHDLVFLTINCTPPRNAEPKKKFFEDYTRYISAEYRDMKWMKNENFPHLIQNIMHNLLVNENLHMENKYSKICSFYYKDGAPMYTLGGFFTSDGEMLNNIASMHEYISFDPNQIHDIAIPHITYKEKHYLDNNILKIKKWIDDYTDLVRLDEPDTNLHEKLIEEFMNKEMDFELKTQEINNYIKHYRFMPQYFEGMI